MYEKLQGGGGWVGGGREATGVEEGGGGEGKNLQNHGKAKGILALTDKFCKLMGSILYTRW